MTIKQLRELIKDLPDDANVFYHAYDKGCCWAAYKYGWCYVDHEKKALIMNPGNDYDDRRPSQWDETKPNGGLPL